MNQDHPWIVSSTKSRDTNGIPPQFLHFSAVPPLYSPVHWQCKNWIGVTEQESTRWLLAAQGWKWTHCHGTHISACTWAQMHTDPDAPCTPLCAHLVCAHNGTPVCVFPGCDFLLMSCDSSLEKIGKMNLEFKCIITFYWRLKTTPPNGYPNTFHLLSKQEW